jgi:hypothetical protein
MESHFSETPMKSEEKKGGIKQYNGQKKSLKGNSSGKSQKYRQCNRQKMMTKGQAMINNTHYIFLLLGEDIFFRIW